MGKYEELIKRLRISAQWADKGLVIMPSICLEAADAIEVLSKEEAEETEEQGLLVRLPCKVGDTVWSRDAEPWTVVSVEWFSKKVTQLHCKSPVTGRGMTFSVGKCSLGKTVFLTREEAKAALKGETEQDDCSRI